MKRIFIVLTTALVVVLAGCASKEQTGTLLGGTAGAVAGSQVGGEAATLIGAVAGGLLGREVGQRLDEQDRQQVASTLENQPTGQESNWTNPDSGEKWSVTPTSTFERDGQPCRRFEMELTGEQDVPDEEVTGVACRVADGSWEIVEQG